MNNCYILQFLNLQIYYILIPANSVQEIKIFLKFITFLIGQKHEFHGDAN